MRFKLFPVLLLSAAVAGCQSGAATKKDSTPRELATQQWNQTRAAVMLNLARDQYATGNFDKCRETLTEALRLDPANPAMHVLSAKLAIEQGQLEAAEKELVAARSLDAHAAEADYLSGVIYQRWQQPAKALEFYQSACDKAPAELAYVMAKGEMLVAMGKPAEALALLQEKVTYFEHSAVIRDAVGMLLLQQKRPDDAVEMLRRATILAPDDVSIREHLAAALFQDKRYADAGDAIGRLLKDESMSKRGDLYLTLAECQLNTGRPIDARASVQTACDLEPSSPAAWLTLAKVAVRLGDARRAEISLRKALALDPASSEGYLLLGYLRLQQSKLDESIACFNQASNLDRTDTVSLCMIGYVMEKLSKPREALRYYAEALKLNSHDEMATELMAGVDARE